MGGAVARGLLTTGFISSEKIKIANPHLDKLKDFAHAGVIVTSSNPEVASSCDVVIIAVKPWLLKEVIFEISSYFDQDKTEIGIIVAGVSSAEILKMFDDKIPENISVVMPNTAMTVGQSMTFIVPLSGKTEKIYSIFRQLGDVKLIEERLLPAATSLASCGIAYAMRYVRAAMEGGVELGFKASEAQEIVSQTMSGAVALLKLPGAHPESEIDKVTTPGGITIKGLNEMEKYGFSTAVIEGLKASKK